MWPKQSALWNLRNSYFRECGASALTPSLGSVFPKVCYVPVQRFSPAPRKDRVNNSISEGLYLGPAGASQAAGRLFIAAFDLRVDKWSMLLARNSRARVDVSPLGWHHIGELLAVLLGQLLEM